MNPDDVLRFWFDETPPARWWKADAAFDRLVADRFAGLHRAAAQAELWAWRASPRGRLAEVIVLDQFSRHLYRGDPRAFAADAMALALAQEAIAAGADTALPAQQRAFLYMPFMHSESRVVHVDAERLFAALGLPDSQRSALRHRAVVDRFGHYPHRNAVLGRASTDDERRFLESPGAGF